MRFNLKALRELKKVGITGANFGESIQDPDSLEKVISIGLEATGKAVEDIDDVTPGEVLDAWVRDCVGESLEKSEKLARQASS